jgi:hypothetical protein
VQKDGLCISGHFSFIHALFETEREKYVLADLDGNWLKGNWYVGVAHASFQKDSVLSLPKNAKCAGFVVFEWGEPETVVSATCD